MQHKIITYVFICLMLALDISAQNLARCIEDYNLWMGSQDIIQMNIVTSYFEDASDSNPTHVDVSQAVLSPNESALMARDFKVLSNHDLSLMIIPSQKEVILKPQKGQVSVLRNVPMLDKFLNVLSDTQVIESITRLGNNSGQCEVSFAIIPKSKQVLERVIHHYSDGFLLNQVEVLFSDDVKEQYGELMRINLEYTSETTTPLLQLNALLVDDHGTWRLKGDYYDYNLTIQ